MFSFSRPGAQNEKVKGLWNENENDNAILQSKGLEVKWPKWYQVLFWDNNGTRSLTAFTACGKIIILTQNALQV